jgi:hypothetical protein
VYFVIQHNHGGRLFKGSTFRALAVWGYPIQRAVEMALRRLDAPASR